MKKVGVIGCGNMGSVLIDAVVSMVGAENVFCFDVDKNKLEFLAKNFKIKPEVSNENVVKNSDIVILAIKPQQFNEVLYKIKEFVTKQKVIVSIAAGVKVRSIEKVLSKKIQIIRCMPNLPMKVSKGVIAICKNKSCSSSNYEFVKKIFFKKGIVLEVKEDLIDLVTALSGSGPAYIFLISDIMQNVAIKLGFSKKLVAKLVNHTILGAAEMLVRETKTAKELMEAVTSKGGTTEQALKVFFENNLYEIFYKAIEKAYLRAKELSK